MSFMLAVRGLLRSFLHYCIFTIFITIIIINTHTQSPPRHAQRAQLLDVVAAVRYIVVRVGGDVASFARHVRHTIVLLAGWYGVIQSASHSCLMGSTRGEGEVLKRGVLHGEGIGRNARYLVGVAIPDTFILFSLCCDIRGGSSRVGRLGYARQSQQRTLDGS